MSSVKAASKADDDATVAKLERLQLQKVAAFEKARILLSEKEQGFLLVSTTDNKGDPLESVLKKTALLAKDRKSENAPVAQFAKRFNHYKAIVERAVNHHPEITSLVWASVGFVLDVYVNHLKSLSELQAALDSILTSMMFGEIYMETYLKAIEDNPIKGTHQSEIYANWKSETDGALSDLYASILVLCVKSRMYFEATGLERLRNAVRPFEEDLAPSIERVKERELFLRKLAEVGTQQQIMGLKGQFDQLLILRLKELEEKLLANTTPEPSAAPFQTLRSIDSEINAQTIFSWLNSVRPETIYLMHHERFLDGTCDWLKCDPIYSSWVNGERSIWLEGIPGGGKSVLASSIVHDLLNEVKRQESVILLYYFFWIDDSPTVSPVAMVSTLISQLLLQSKAETKDRFMQILKDAVLEASHFKGSKSSDELELRTRCALLSRMLSEYRSTGRVLILLDALDECSNPDAVAKELFAGSGSRSAHQKTFNSEEFSHVKFLLTGRPVVSELFSKLPGFKRIDMNSREDIKKVVTMNIEANPHLKRIESQILEKILRTSDGMFRYAALLFEELLAVNVPIRPLEERLAAMPAGISGMYEVMLERLDIDSLEYRRRIFLSIAAAVEPLTIRELQGIWITDFEKKQCDYKRVPIPSRDQILASCGSLISVRGVHSPTLANFDCSVEPEYFESREENQRPDSIVDEQDDYVIVFPFDRETVRFSHRTVGEFLRLPLHKHSEKARNSLEISSCLFELECAERFLAIVCAIQLMSPFIADSLSSNKLYSRKFHDLDAHGDPLWFDPVMVSIFSDSFMGGYALNNWYYHLIKVSFRVTEVDFITTSKLAASSASILESSQPDGNVAAERTSLEGIRMQHFAQITSDDVFDSFAQLFWDPGLLRSRIGFLTVTSLLCFTELNLTWVKAFGGRSSSVPQYIQFFLRHYFTKVPGTISRTTPTETSYKSVSTTNTIVDVASTSNQPPEDLDLVTIHGFYWDETELFGLLYSLVIMILVSEDGTQFKPQLFRKNLRYSVNINKSAHRRLDLISRPNLSLLNQIPGLSEHHAIQPSLPIMKIHDLLYTSRGSELPGVLSPSEVARWIEYLLDYYPQTDVNAEGNYSGISTTSGTTLPEIKYTEKTGTFLHYLCERMVLHHIAGLYYGREDFAKLAESVPVLADSDDDFFHNALTDVTNQCENMKDCQWGIILSLVLGRHGSGPGSLEINALDSEGYSPLAILLSTSEDGRYFRVNHSKWTLFNMMGHTNSSRETSRSYWCYDETNSQKIVEMMKEKGAKAIFPKNHPHYRITSVENGEEAATAEATSISAHGTKGKTEVKHREDLSEDRDGQTLKAKIKRGKERMISGGRRLLSRSKASGKEKEGK